MRFMVCRDVACNVRTERYKNIRQPRFDLPENPQANDIGSALACRKFTKKAIPEKRLNLSVQTVIQPYQNRFEF
ncbi:hypothetical protein PEPS_35930 (plasmid) [Persicobacter psychrovividus]|uniref:Uncharacterized protein n=1 Tax=Persicobacter psychrovividus TaxID=387638 RepID=A0ABM7VJY2_9BACT|nr:hypothetical protein PEPS_35930 [Persicobacter psychrovividus]